MERLALLERELAFLDLLDKARKIYGELGKERALSYLRSHFRLLSKVYHPDMNPGNEEKAKILQQRLNRANKLINEASDEELIALLGKTVIEEPLRKKKILVVEDEFGLQETLRDVFTMEGYDTRTAIDGENGYQVFLEFSPDLVLTDVVMPNMNGLDLVKKIREINSAIKVIYISGFFGIRNFKREVNDEALKYDYPCLSKPFKMSALLDLVDRYLNNRARVNVYT